jgi:hypothetical protein
MNDPRVPDLKPTSAPTEWSEVERPLLLQLAGKSWRINQLMIVSSF